MAKFTDAAVATLKALFETGDQPTEAQFAAVFDAIQQGIEEHDHNVLGDGDAAQITHLDCGDRVAQFYLRQGGHATRWSDSGTTGYTPGEVRMMAGAIEWTGSVANTGTKEVIFPAAFSDFPLVFLLPFASPANILCSCSIIAADGFTLKWRDVQSLTHSSGVFVWWLAIGPE